MSEKMYFSNEREKPNSSLEKLEKPEVDERSIAEFLKKFNVSPDLANHPAFEKGCV